MKKNIFMTTALTFTLFTASASQYPTDLSGKYLCDGTEYDTGTAFKCDMSLKKTGHTYQAQYNCNDGQSYIGTAIYEQDKHHLTMVFINPKKSEETGVSSANIKKDGAMTAKWTYLNKTTLGHTFCFKHKKWS